MAMTLRNTDILFNDSTTQSTAFNATAVLNATAGASAGAVGTYAFATHESPTTPFNFGDTISGSLLYPSNATGALLGSTFAGTWRSMGTLQFAGRQTRTSLWLRIS